MEPSMTDDPPLGLKSRPITVFDDIESLNSI